MRSAPRARWHTFLLLIAFICSAAVPRVFVVCMSENDHFALEADFEAEPCEANFIFGAGDGVSWPLATCTDIPAIQLSARTDDSRTLVVVAPLATSSAPSARTTPIRHLTDWRDGPRPARMAHLALRTTVLRL